MTEIKNQHNTQSSTAMAAANVIERMAETKQNLEEEFDEKFPTDFIRHQHEEQAVEEQEYIEVSNYAHSRSKLKDFIHKVRTEAILEERKRIEEDIENFRKRAYNLYQGNRAADYNQGLDDILQIINNKNI